MLKKKSISWNLLFLCILIPLAGALISSLLTQSSYLLYQTVKKPPFSPPNWIFGIVWPLLYLFMGISSYLIVTSDAPPEAKQNALFTYGIQLFVNLIWPILFFNEQAFLLSFFWLVFLLILVVRMILQFFKASPAAAYLQIPYLIWSIFAAYLNLAVVILN